VRQTNINSVQECNKYGGYEAMLLPYQLIKVSLL